MPQDVNAERPPAGVSFEESGDGFVLAGSLRSPDSLIRVAASCVFAYALLYAVFGCQACGFRNPRSTVVVLLIALLVLLNAMNKIFGRIVVSRRGDELEILRAVGVFGRPHKMRWSDVVEIREELGPRKRLGGRSKLIAIIACPKLTSGTYYPADKIRFGSQLADERRKFMLKLLQARQPTEE